MAMSSSQTGGTIERNADAGARRGDNGTLAMRLRELYASVPAAEDAKQPRGGGLAVQQLLEVLRSFASKPSELVRSLYMTTDCATDSRSDRALYQV